MKVTIAPVLAPGDGDAASGGLPLGVVEGGDHLHAWRRLPNSVGLFACRDRECLWYAVCPSCLGSLAVALRVRDGVVGIVLYWCPAHQGGGEHDGKP